MSETTLGETPVERRLREIGAAFSDGTPTRNAIDAGREALALLREFAARPLGDAPATEKLARFVADASALLARCEGDR